MNETSHVIRGTLNPDGTLELAERPDLPAGPVEVTIRPVAEVPKSGNWFDYLRRARAELEASGAVFRTKEEIDADIEEMRDWGEDGLEAARRAGEGYGPYLARIRARREAEGFPFRTKEEIDEDIENLRSWDEPGGGVARDDKSREPDHR